MVVSSGGDWREALSASLRPGEYVQARAAAQLVAPESRSVEVIMTTDAVMLIDHDRPDDFEWRQTWAPSLAATTNRTTEMLDLRVPRSEGGFRMARCRFGRRSFRVAQKIELRCRQVSELAGVVDGSGYSAVVPLPMLARFLSRERTLRRSLRDVWLPPGLEEPS